MKLDFSVGVGYGCVDKTKDGGGEAEIPGRAEEGSHRERYFNCQDEDQRKNGGWAGS